MYSNACMGSQVTFQLAAALVGDAIQDIITALDQAAQFSDDEWQTKLLHPVSGRACHMLADCWHMLVYYSYLTTGADS
jgi:hypothetical protein